MALIDDISMRRDRFGVFFVHKNKALSELVEKTERKCARWAEARAKERDRCRFGLPSERLALACAEMGFGVFAVSRYVPTRIAKLLVTGEGSQE